MKKTKINAPTFLLGNGYLLTGKNLAILYI